MLVARSELSPGTPKEILRHKIRDLSKDYSELSEYTTLEKQTYFDDYNCELKEKFTKCAMIEKELENATSDKNDLEHIVSDLRKRLTETELRNVTVEDQLNAQMINLQKISDLEKKVTQLSGLEKEVQNILGLKEQIKFLTAEKESYECVANELRKKLNKTEQCNILLEEKLTQIKEVEEPLIRFSIGDKSVQQIELKTQIATLEFDKDELQREICHLQNKLTDSELCNNTLKNKLDEQLTHIQNREHLEKQINDLILEKNKFECTVSEMQNKLKELDEINISMRDKLCKQQLELEELKDQDKLIEQLVSEKQKFELVTVELQEKLIEAEATIILMKNKHQRNVYDFVQVEDQGVTEKIERERIDELSEKLSETGSLNNSMKIKSDEQQLQEICDFDKQIDNLSVTRISLEEEYSAKLSADLIMKTQELDDIKQGVQSLKKDIQNLQEAILLLTTENTELANKLTAEKECAEKSNMHLQETIDELCVRNLKIVNEKLELENTVAILDVEMEMLREKIPETNLNEEQLIFKYEEEINILNAKNAELSFNVTDLMKELETLKESKSLLYEHDCMYKDKLTNLEEKYKYLTTENNKLSTNLMDKIDENEGLEEECNILQNKLKLYLENRENIDKSDVQQVRKENISLKAKLLELEINIKTLTEKNSKMSNQLEEAIEDLDNARNVNSCNNSLHLSTIFNNTLTLNDTVNKSVMACNSEMSLREEINQLMNLNQKLSDLKLSNCTQCTHLKELNENRRMLKLQVKSLSHKLIDLQRKFNSKSAETDALIMKAKEDINTSLCNSSFNVSFSDNMNVTVVEEKLQSLNNELQTLKQSDDELSNLDKEKCDVIEELCSSNNMDSILSDDINSSIKKPSNKTVSRLDNILKVMNNLQNELQEIKKNNLSVRIDLEKFTDEKKSLLLEINSLKNANEELLQKLTGNKLSLTTVNERADILENEVTDMTKKLQESSVKCKEIENEKLLLEVELENMKEDKIMKERTVGELRQSLSCIQHELDLIKKEKEELDNSNNFLEHEYEKQVESLKTINKELINSKEIISQNFADYSKESESKLLKLNEKIDKCVTENDYLKQELIKLREIESKFEKMKNECQSKLQQDKTLVEDNKKLKDALNTAAKNIIKEIASLKPKFDEKKFLDKSVDELFQIFLETILAKEKEIVRTMQELFYREKRKLEDEKQQSMDTEKRTTSWAKELESEIEKLQGDLSEREKISNDFQKEVARLKELLEENNRDRNALREKISLLEMDLNNLQVELNKYSKIDIVNEEAIIIAQKREKQAQETIKNKETEFQIKLKSEKEVYNRRIEDLVCTVESFKTKNMELTSNIEGLEANQKQLTNIIDLKTNELAKSHQIIQKTQTELNLLSETYNNLNDELEKKTLHIAEITGILKTKCDELTEYKTNLETIVPENKFLKQQISERKASMEQYRIEIETLKMEHEKIIDVIKDDLNLEEMKSVELNKKIVELNNKNIVLTEEINTLKNNYETLQCKCITLEKRVRNSTSKIQAEEQMEELKDLNRSLRNNLDGASNRITELQTTKTDLMKQVVTLNSQYEVACRENAELKETLSSYELKYSGANTASEKCDALVREKNQIALELEAAKVQLHQRNKHIESCEIKIKELTESNAELDKEAEQLADEIRQYDFDNTDLQDKYYTCREEISTLQDKIKALEKKDQNSSSQSTLDETVSSDRTIRPSHDECNCTGLKNKVRELQFEVVEKNGKIASLELQIRSGSFPYQMKCKELQDELFAHSNKVVKNLS